MKRFFLITLFLTLFTCSLFSQNEVDRLIETAIFKMDNGDYQESILLLEKAQKLEPENSIVKYEMSYAYYLQKDYKKAIKILNKLVKEEKPKDYYYQMLGNAYDLKGDSKKAIKIYEQGLKKFPNSGKMYLETGNVYFNQKNYTAAIQWYEKGIDADPDFPSNYFRAAHLYLNSDFEVWGLIYGEIFMHIENSTKRTEAMSKMLFDAYKSQISFNDTSIEVSFYKNVININYNPDNDDPNALLEAMLEAKKKGDDMKNRSWGTGVFEKILSLSLIGEKEISLASLNRIRSKFVDIYFEEKQNEKYPIVLFDFQKKIKDAGHLEAYNYWLLSYGNIEEFNAWLKDNKDRFDAFVGWINENAIVLKDSNKFVRGQIERN
ncbi:MAG: tetratricopeptide repeat protein [Bacteroidales bacterium]|nr:tetratricopeptide repeat protein [Bacteroidales bacterium]MDD4529191.1 tetratricopeptide repeat protein [Bacteroidales bacterium]MDD4829068.1 tetratricopeptide repeat protein [Bacteroidales bacterium]